MRLSLCGVRGGRFRMLLFGVITLGSVWMLLQENTGKQTGLSPMSTAVASPVQGKSGQPQGELLTAEGLSLMFRTAAKKVLPSVVVIKAGSSPACPRCGRHHAHHAENEDEPDQPLAARSLDVLGSGFIVDPSGIVLTNKHVANAGQRLVVQTADGKQYPVKEVKTDQEYDLAYRVHKATRFRSPWRLSEGGYRGLGLDGRLSA